MWWWWGKEEWLEEGGDHYSTLGLFLVQKMSGGGGQFCSFPERGNRAKMIAAIRSTTFPQRKINSIFEFICLLYIFFGWGTRVPSRCYCCPSGAGTIDDTSLEEGGERNKSNGVSPAINLWPLTPHALPNQDGSEAHNNNENIFSCLERRQTVAQYC